MNRSGLKLWFVLLSLFLIFPSSSCAVTTSKDPNPLRLNKAVNRFIWQDAKNSFPSGSLLFVGSSSIYRWKTATNFPTLPVINRGLGGAQISDLSHYYEDIVKRYKPTKVIFYCGDNDVAAGKGAEQILSDFKLFAERLKKDFPHVELLFLAIKPSSLRWSMWQIMKDSNRFIKSYCHDSNSCSYIDTANPLLNSEGRPDKNLFVADGIHLNRTGYEVWEAILAPYLLKKPLLKRF